MTRKVAISALSLPILSLLLWTSPVLSQGKVKPLKYGEDSLSCFQNLAYSHQLIKENRKAEALVPWRWVYNYCPAASENIYLDGAAIFNFLINRETDSTKRQILVDTLMMIYDQRIKYFRKDGYVLGRKGAELYQLCPTRGLEALSVMKRSIKMEFRQSRPPILVNYFKCALDLQKKGIIDTIDVYQAYDDIRDILDYNCLYDTVEGQLYASAKATVEQDYNDFSPCNEIEAKYGPVYMSDTSNLEQIVSIIHAFEQRKCNGSRFYIYLIDRIYDLNPCPASALMAANFYKVSNHPFLAKRFYDIAVATKDTTIRCEVFLLLADLQLNSFHNYVDASHHVKRAIMLKPNQATPYILLGDIYVLGVEACGNNDLAKYGLYWIAADQYEKAKSLDSSLTTMINEKVTTIYRLFPDADYLSRNNLKVGDSFNVDCIANQSTTVKVKP